MRATCSKINDWVNWGRLGNQMWQLAHLVGYSKKQSIPFNWAIPKWNYSKYFEGPFNEVEVIPEGFIDHSEKGFHYNDVPPIHDVNFLGYWQSPKYWSHCEKDIRDMFTFKPEIVHKIQHFIYKHAGTKVPVFIHKRRGDYVEGMAHYYHDLSLEWYEQAMSQFDPATHHFFLCSDDTNWCHHNFRVYVEGQTPHITLSTFDDIHDLCLMSQCAHGIMCNSSFSFWGQFLISNPNKIIVAPTKDKWFKPVAGHNMDDLYYNQNWILL